MNDQMTSSPGASLIPDGTSLITGTHLAVMAVFAVLVIIGILWGVRLKRRRHAADREIVQDNRDIGTTDRAPLGGAAQEPGQASAAAGRQDVPPAPSPAAGAAAPTPGTGSDAAGAIPVTRLKGLGPKVAARLAELGIADARQLAALSEADAVALDAQLGGFAGRMVRDRWIEQARLLAAGDTAGFEAAFGRL